MFHCHIAHPYLPSESISCLDPPIFALVLRTRANIGGSRQDMDSSGQIWVQYEMAHVIIYITFDSRMKITKIVQNLKNQLFSVSMATKHLNNLMFYR